jgi:hypothetical protein
MPAKPLNHTATDDPIAAISNCALDESGRREQLARYKQLAAAVTRVESKPETVVVQFGECLDRDLLERTLAVERACCPFFVFQLDDAEQRLQITVREREQQPALEAMAAAFYAVQPASGREPGGEA